jgi:hypothetical protein
MTRVAAYTAIALSVAVLVLLAALHVLSPEFDPSWRVVSEYANGRYGWVLSLLFACWSVSSWSLAYSLKPLRSSRTGRVGLWILVIAGLGQAIASAFDVNQPLHGLADLLGAGGLPVAAMLTSIAIVRSRPSLPGRAALLFLANLTWISTLAIIASVVVLFVTFTHAGGHVPSDGTPLPMSAVLPAGTVGLVGYANRLYVIAACLWAILAARVSASDSILGRNIVAMTGERFMFSLKRVERRQA